MHRANMSTWVFDLKIVCTEIETNHGQHQMKQMKEMEFVYE